MDNDRQECSPRCRTTGDCQGCGPECTWQDYAESIRDWLVANGVDWDTTVMWPEILIADDDQTFQVEQFQQDKHGRTELMHGLGFGAGTLTTLKTYEQRVPIDPELIVAYRFSRPKALEAAKREAIKSVLRFHPPAVMLRGGETLIFATRDRPDRDINAEVQRVLQEALPGVNVVFAGGVDTILAGPGPISL